MEEERVRAQLQNSGWAGKGAEVGARGKTLSPKLECSRISKPERIWNSSLPSLPTYTPDSHQVQGLLTSPDPERAETLSCLQSVLV